jgi:hypothetical protein
MKIKKSEVVEQQLIVESRAMQEQNKMLESEMLKSKSLIKELSKKTPISSAESQTCITNIPSCTLYEWEFQDSEEWMPMDARTSSAIELCLKRVDRVQGSLASNGRKENLLLYGNYEFNLSCMKQKNLSSQRSRAIRRGRSLINDWETVFGANKALEFKLCRSENENEALVGQCETVQIQNRALEQRLLQLQCKCKRLDDDSQNLLEKNKEIRIELSASEHRNKILIDEANDRRIHNNEQEHELLKSRGEITTLQNESLRMKISERENKAKIDALSVSSETHALEVCSCRFQLAVMHILHAIRGPSEQGPGASARLACSSASHDGWLRCFGEWVRKEFSRTRAQHRRGLSPGVGMCEPAFEVLEVEALTNPDLAQRQRQYMQRAEMGGSAGHQYRAHRVASSAEGMKITGLLAGKECFNEGMLLGWHGASDDVVSNILKKGFNPFCAGSGAGSLFGKGIYFAENSSKADLYAGPSADRFKKPAGSMSVILAALYCGNMFEAKTAGAWTEPPSPTAVQTQATGIQR